MSFLIRKKKKKGRIYEYLSVVKDGEEIHIGSEKVLLEMKQHYDLLKGKGGLLE